MTAEDTELLLAFVRGSLDPEAAAEMQARLSREPDLRSVLALVKAVSQTAETSSLQFSANEVGWHRLKQAIGETNSGVSPARAGVSLWQAAAVSIAMGFAGWQLGSFSADGLPADEPAQYVPSGSPINISTRATVSFRPDVEHRALRDLVRAVDAQIVSGPSALGFYTLEFGSAEARAAGLSRLKEQTEIVDEVHPG